MISVDFIADGSFILPLALKSQSQLTKTKIKLHKEQNGGCLSRVGGERVGKMGEGVQEVQTPSYTINKAWGCNVQHDDYSQ